MEELKTIEAELLKAVSELEKIETHESKAVCRILYATLGAINGGGLETLEIFVAHATRINRDKLQIELSRQAAQ